MLKKPHDLVSWCRFILVILNISGLFIGLILLGASIFLLVDKGNLLTDVMSLPLAEPACIILIAVSAAAVFLTATNLLGVLGNIKGLLIFNVLMHSILALLALISAIFAIICVVNNTDWIRQAMRESLQQRYGVDVGNNTINTYETKMWDIAQQRWYCCGVEDNSWGTYRSSSWYDIQPGKKEYTKPLVPVSCCVTNQYGRIVDVQKCQMWQSGPPKLTSGIYNEALYYPGCYAFGLTVLSQVSRGVVIMGFIMAFLQLGAVFCTIVVLLSMRKTQTPYILKSRSGTLAGGSMIYDPESEYSFKSAEIIGKEFLNVMNSISPECQELKNQYDTCFNKWFKEKFLKGDADDSCNDIFTKYQNCVKKAIQEKNIDLKELQADVLGTPQEKQPPKPN